MPLITENIACKISDAEWLIMKVIWQESQLTASAVTECLKSEVDWSPKTIQTLIRRLVKKGALGVNKDSSLYEYYPLVSKEECKHEETKTFLQKVYDGSLYGLIANFVKNENLSPKDIERLKCLLNEKMK
jgi:BlaI family penicillinase repressor